MARLLNPALVTIAAVVLASCGASDDAVRTGASPAESPTTEVADDDETASPPPVLDESAYWRRIDLHSEYEDENGDSRRLQAILLDVEEEGVVDLTQPAPIRFGMEAVAFDADKTQLVLAIAGSLGACHYLDGVEVDSTSSEVVLVPRLARKHGENYGGSVTPWGEPIPSCPQSDVALAALVHLDEPLGDRAMRVLRCTGPGRDDCEEMERFTADEVALVTSVDVTCVPVDLLMEIQRDIYDRLDRCDPDAEPMQGIWE